VKFEVVCFGEKAEGRVVWETHFIVSVRPSVYVVTPTLRSVYALAPGKFNIVLMVVRPTIVKIASALGSVADPEDVEMEVLRV